MLKRTSIILTLFIAVVAWSCKKKENNYFPHVSFEQYVYLNNPSSYPLTAPGGWIYMDGGYKGLIIYRRYISGSAHDFAAYDKACPEHYDKDCGVLKVVDDGLFAQCQCNMEKYLLMDGSPSSGAKLGLIPYSIYLNGDVLYISN